MISIKLNFLKFYKYPNTSKFILNKLNFTLYKGEKITIVGRTGLGKSTY